MSGSTSAAIDDFLRISHTIGPAGRSVTDKTSGAFKTFLGHTYHKMYGIFLGPLRDLPIRFFEIGLGCGAASMSGQAKNLNRNRTRKSSGLREESVGGSMRIWPHWFRNPYAQFYAAEFDAACIEKAKRQGMYAGTSVVVGDQEDPKVVERWVSETGRRKISQRKFLDNIII